MCNFTAQIDDNGNIVKVTSNPNQLPTAQNVTVVSPYIIMGNSIKYSFDLVNSLDADVSNAFLPQILVKDSTTDELIVYCRGRSGDRSFTRQRDKAPDLRQRHDRDR